MPSATVNIAPYLDNFSNRAQEGCKLRKLPAESIRDLRESGLFRSLVPSQLGGLESTPNEFFAIQSRIAEYDMSTAWVGGIIAIHAFQIAMMDEKAQQDVYGKSPDTCVSSSYNPVGGKTEPVEGGLMLSGHWGWSSGSDHCEWTLLGGIVAGEGYRTFLVPRSDYSIEDTWHSMGLQATGSNDIVIDKPVFVPDYRTHKQLDGFNCVNTQPSYLYNLPWAQTFIRVVSTPAIGAAKHALKLFIKNARTSSTDPLKLVGDPDILRRIVQVENKIDQTETIMRRNFDVMHSLLEAGKPVPLVDRVRYRYQASIVIEEMSQAVDLLFDVAGGRSVFANAAIQNIWHDIHTARAHVANHPIGFARNWGNIMLGGENQDMFV